MIQPEGTNLRIGVEITTGPVTRRVGAPLHHSKRRHRTGKQICRIATTARAPEHLHVGGQVLKWICLEPHTRTQ